MARTLLLILIAATLTTCGQGNPEKAIIPPATPPLSRHIIGYGVVSINYTHVFDKRGNDGAALGILRKGAIVEVLERRPLIVDGKAEKWVLATNGAYAGWLNENRIRIYDTRPRAQTAAGALSQ
ncbi:MAG: hypothetical protein LBS82_02730 [Spirochaetaceae bacterium]|jgi:hypothetical protein|nr:hypothetical protein [Spirochaetaceae bacterium]